MYKFTIEEERQLLKDCGFSTEINFLDVPDDLKIKILNLMHQWRWETNQKKFLDDNPRSVVLCKGTTITGPR